MCVTCLSCTVVGDTSSIECAHQLGKLCENRNVVVNLIPYNPTNVSDPLSCPSMDHMLEFQQIVKSYGCLCFIRKTMGQDISGACGQLVVETERRELLLTQGKVEGVSGGGESEIMDIENSPFRDDARQNSRNAIIKNARVRTREPSKVEDATPTTTTISDPTENIAYSTLATVDTSNQNQSAALDAASLPLDTDDKYASHHQRVRKKKDVVHDNLSQWIGPLTVATSISFSCFVISSIFYVMRRQRR